jgi:murein DD-endopeptidase MepM/ murein hydrolase activator NlpD
MEDVERSRRILFTGRAAPESLASFLTVYVYTPGESEDILQVAARCSLPYESIATLNRIPHPEDFKAGEAAFLPSIPGLFIPGTPGNDLERLLLSSRAESPFLTITVNRVKYRFLPGEELTPTERAFFLNRGFHFPLVNYRLSSAYGQRVNPVTGRRGMHKGIDLAAPEGEAVFAARAGTVQDQGEDPVFGKYIILSHESDWVSLYGHLSKIETVLNQEVQSASLIGRVGSTGQSTGPHLHFELRQNGRARDPGRLLGLFRGN